MADGKKAGGNGLVMVLLGVNTVAMLAVAGLMAHNHFQEAKKEKLEDIVAGQQAGRDVAAIDPKGEKKGKGLLPAAVEKMRVFEMETFTANLANPRVPKYVRVRVEFELDEMVKNKELDRKKPQIRDEILTILNGKRDKELLTVNGKNWLKEEIQNSVNSVLVSGKVKSVLFTDFLIN